MDSTTGFYSPLGETIGPYLLILLTGVIIGLALYGLKTKRRN